MELLKALNWRYATKKFDPDLKISEEDLATIKEVLRLTPSSYGLQPLKYLIVEDPEIREKLKNASFGQSQITDASHLIVICSYLDIKNEDIDDYIKITAESRSIDPESLARYGDFMKRTFQPLTTETKKSWNTSQAYIALGQLLFACAQMGIDSIPMEGFDASKYDEILGLRSRGLHAALVCPIGYRSKDDTHQFSKKVRKSSDDLFETI